MKTIIVKAVNRIYPDNIGDYLWECLASSIGDLDIKLIRLPSELFYKEGIKLKESARLEVNWVNQQNADAFIFFTNWIGGARYRDVAMAYKNMKCKCIFWSREDPNHFHNFLTDTRYADIIATSDRDCVKLYQDVYPSKQVICLPMACAPDIFYGNLHDYNNREWDIVFIGNRYIKRDVRNNGENAIVIAAAKFALANNLKMGVWGIPDGVHGWGNVDEIIKTGIYQGRCDRLEAAEIYRNAKVALSVASNDNSPTMAPNRVAQIAGTGTILISYSSVATLWQTGHFSHISTSAGHTNYFLSLIFNDDPKDFIDAALNAKNCIMHNHTFNHRLKTIMEALNEI